MTHYLSALGGICCGWLIASFIADVSLLVTVAFLLGAAVMTGVFLLNKVFK